jgi:hypothetical protein
VVPAEATSTSWRRTSPSGNGARCPIVGRSETPASSSRGRPQGHRARSAGQASHGVVNRGVPRPPRTQVHAHEPGIERLSSREAVVALSGVTPCGVRTCRAVAGRRFLRRGSSCADRLRRSPLGFGGAAHRCPGLGRLLRSARYDGPREVRPSTSRWGAGRPDERWHQRAASVQWPMVGALRDTAVGS